MEGLGDTLKAQMRLTDHEFLGCKTKLGTLPMTIARDFGYCV